MLQVISSFYKNFSKISLFVPAKTDGKFVVSKDFYVADHDNNMCFLPNSRYHVLLERDNEKVLQKLDAFCSTNQHVDCQYMFFK